MSTGQSSKSASKSDKKSKRKSLDDGSLPSTESDAQVKAKADAVRLKKQKEKSKGEAVEEVKNAQELKSELASTLSSASTPLPASTLDKKTKTKGKATKEVEQPKEPALSTISKPEKKKKTKGEDAKDKKLEKPPASGSAELVPKSEKKKVKGEAMKEAKKLEVSVSPPTRLTPAAEKQKKKTKSGGSENIDGPTKPATNSTPPSVPKSISATSRASAPSKPPKASDKAFQKSKKIKAKEPSPSPSASSATESEKVEEAAGDNDSEKEEDEEDLHLHGFSTDDDDSSDEDIDMDYEVPALDISKLPTIAKDDATVKRKLEKAKRQPTEDRGVVYIGRVPHGFYEDQMRGYFSQFGNVTRVRLSRNKKTGRSKHYGFVEFDSSSVAQIVAETMDNYLLTGHILRCKVIPKDEVHPELWVGANRKWRVVPRDRITRVQHNKSRTEDERTRTAKRLIKRQNERKRKLAEAGIKYDFEAVSYKKMKEA